MGQIIGREINFAVGVEAIRGTAETTASKTVRKVTCNLIPRAERIVDDSTFGGLEDAERVRTVRKWSEGDVDGVVHADVIGYFLANLYGEISTAPDGNAFIHTFVLSNSITHPTLTLFVKDGSIRQEKIAGGVIDSLAIKAKTDDFVRYTASFIGKAGVTDASVLPALDTEYDFVSRDISVKLDDSDAFANPAIKLKDLTITWKANAEADYTFGSYSPDNIYNKQFAIEGEFTRNFEDTTFKDLYEGDDFKYMELDIKGEAEIDTGINPELKVTLYKVQITDWSRGSAGDELTTEKVSFKAFLNTTETKASEVELTNLTAEYIIGS